jgi:undecaprenyl-diphosphatase
LNVIIFKYINHHLATPFLDPLMLTFTFLGEGIVASGISLFLIIYGIVKKQTIIHNAGCGGLLSYALSGIISSVIKNIVNSPRPLFELFDVRVVGDILFTKGFPSGHTTTAFALASALGVFFPKLRIYLLGVASLVGLSRIYVGAHYPADVLGGAVLGYLTGLFSAWIILRQKKNREQDSRKNVENEKCLVE